MKHLAYLALGSNLGDRPANLLKALALLEPQANVLRASKIYETPPWGFLDQPAFLNQVAEIETDLSPLELLEHFKQIEQKMGRIKTISNGPRSIDLDLLFFDDQILDLPGLTVPHPRMQGRGFVLVPMADLAPDLVHPSLGQTISEMCEQADRDGIRVYSGSSQ